MGQDGDREATLSGACLLLLSLGVLDAKGMVGVDLLCVLVVCGFLD